MNAIINLTQHAATPEQVAAGVVDLKGEDLASLKRLLTFDELPTSAEVYNAAAMIADLADAELAELPMIRQAMIGGAPFLMGPLETTLRLRRIEPIYAFSKRVSEDQPQADGSVKKVAVFRHVGFVPAIGDGR